MGTQSGHVPVAPWAGAEGLGAAPKSVSVGPGEAQRLGRTSGRGWAFLPQFLPQHLPGLRPEYPELEWIGM